MPQLHLYLPEEIASLVRVRARARKMTVSGYLADLVRREVAAGVAAGLLRRGGGRMDGASPPSPPPSAAPSGATRSEEAVAFLLDTNVCIRILNGTSPAVAARLQAT